MSPGRLEDPAITLGDDPRVDPRIAFALGPHGLDSHSPPPPVTPGDPREALLEFVAQVEQGFEVVFGALSDGLPTITGVTREEVRIPGADGAHEITLFIHRPQAHDGPLPALVHLHGGGMTLLTAADPVYARERDELAATGLIVVGVEFRNAAGRLGAHPFPAGLDDCVDGARWTVAHLAELGASGVVVSGESGGGNLTLALSHRAKREGWLDAIAGFYAQCPFIYGDWGNPPAELPSMVENDAYLVGCQLFAILAELYDPGSVNAHDPECWPVHATVDELRGMPPHVISVNECDPLRDEGLAYYRALIQARVSTAGRIVAGTCHGGDILFPAAIPEVHAATIRDVHGFACDAVAGIAQT